MKDNTTPVDPSKTQQQKTKKSPWRDALERKDLTSPIIIRRTLLRNAGLVLLLVVVTGFYAWRSFFRQPNGSELVQQMVDAAGGMDAWNNIRQGKFTRTHRVYSINGTLLQTTRETFYFNKTDKGVQLQVRASGQTGEEVWVGKDDNGYWASAENKVADPKVTAKNLGMMCDSKFCEPLCAASMAFYRFSMPFKLTDAGVLPSLISADMATAAHQAGKRQAALLLDITFDPSVGRDRWRFIVDSQDKLIRKVEYHNKSDQGQSRPEEIYWSDYRKQSGINFSHKWTRYWANGQVMDEYVFSEVDFSTKLPEKFFDRPARFTALAKP